MSYEKSDKYEILDPFFPIGIDYKSKLMNKIEIEIILGTLYKKVPYGPAVFKFNSSLGT